MCILIITLASLFCCSCTTYLPNDLIKLINLQIHQIHSTQPNKSSRSKVSIGNNLHIKYIYMYHCIYDHAYIQTYIYFNSYIIYSCIYIIHSHIIYNTYKCIYTLNFSYIYMYMNECLLDLSNVYIQKSNKWQRSQNLEELFYFCAQVQQPSF